MNIFFFNLTILFSVIIFTKKNNLSFWEFISNLSNKKRAILASLTLGLPICFGLFYSYLISLENFTWYFIVFLMILSVGVYYVVSIITNFIILNFLSKNVKTRQIMPEFTLKTIFLFEALVFSVLAFVFKENENIFWILFYCIPIYRFAIVLFQKIMRKV